MSHFAKPIYLSGQTGSGKTSVAIELARRIGNVEIVNADAFQIYRDMPILSAAPTPEERSTVPHHLFEFLNSSEECDAARFSKIARDTITEVQDRGATPLVVGGSGLYLKAITHGLAPTPKGDPELRAKLDRLSLEDLVDRYRQLDPAGAEQTNLKNRRYVTRNLEISILTGQPASELKQAWAEDSPDLCAFYLSRSRADIYDRINRRTLQMFENGVVQEVTELGEQSPTARKAIGISEIRGLLSGEIDQATCIDTIQTITRRYAKRQEFWFKRETAFIPVSVSPDDEPDSVAGRILEHIKNSEAGLA